MKISSILLFGVTILSAATSIASAAEPVVFYGGSSIHRWNQGPTFDANFRRPIFNHDVIITGHSGAMLDTLTATATTEVWTLKPRVVVFYGGENDLRAGGETGVGDKKAEDVLADFREFVENRDASASEASAILFVSIKPSVDYFYKEGLPTAAQAIEAVSAANATPESPESPAIPASPNTGPAATAEQAAISERRRKEAWKTNTMIHKWILSDRNPHKNLYYISIWQPMLAQGKGTLSDIRDDKPKFSYFEDFTHLTQDGYEVWAEEIRPRLERIWDLTPPVN